MKEFLPNDVEFFIFLLATFWHHQLFAWNRYLLLFIYSSIRFKLLNVNLSHSHNNLWVNVFCVIVKFQNIFLFSIWNRNDSLLLVVVLLLHNVHCQLTFLSWLFIHSHYHIHSINLAKSNNKWRQRTNQTILSRLLNDKYGRKKTLIPCNYLGFCLPFIKKKTESCCENDRNPWSFVILIVQIFTFLFHQTHTHTLITVDQ